MALLSYSGSLSNKGTLAKTIRVANIPDDFIFVSDSQEVAAIYEYLGIPAQEIQRYSSLFVLIGDSELKAVYGLEGIVPFLEKKAYLLAINGRALAQDEED